METWRDEQNDNGFTGRTEKIPSAIVMPPCSTVRLADKSIEPLGAPVFMAWIRSEQSVERHPKKLELQTLLQVDSDTVIGRLHRFWWWCLDYALDGDLRKHTPETLCAACDIPLEMLIKVRLVDTTPHLRIHDWWDFVGNYLKMRFKDHPQKWREIEQQYNTTRNTIRNTPSNPVDVETYGRTDVDVERKREKDVEGQSTDFASHGSTSTPKKFVPRPFPEGVEVDVDPLPGLKKAGRIKPRS